MCGPMLSYQVIPAIVNTVDYPSTGRLLIVYQHSYPGPGCIGRNSEYYNQCFAGQFFGTFGEIMLGDKDSSRAIFYFS